MFNMELSWSDTKTIKRIVNQGIDSRLEGFTKSSFIFNSSSGKLDCQIHPSELQILIRRLLKDGDDDAEMLADDIVMVEYGYQTV